RLDYFVDPLKNHTRYVVTIRTTTQPGEESYASPWPSWTLLRAVRHCRDRRPVGLRYAGPHGSGELPARMRQAGHRPQYAELRQLHAAAAEAAGRRGRARHGPRRHAAPQVARGAPSGHPGGEYLDPGRREGHGEHRLEDPAQPQVAGRHAAA